MKKFVAKIVMMALLVTGIWGTLWCGIYKYTFLKAAAHKGHGPVWISHNINPALQKQRLAACKEPKLVVIGGSNASLGLKSELLHEHYGRPIFNTGNNASVGLRMQIAMFEQYLTKDDIVVVIPEYHQFGRVFWGTTILCHVLMTDKVFVKHITPYQALRLSADWNEWIALAKEAADPDYTGKLAYSSASLNEYGDVANQREHTAFEPFDISSVGTLKRAPFRYLESFIERCEATTILMPPIIDRQSYENLSELIDSVAVELEVRGIPFAVDTRRYAWPDSMFYDTGYHLTTAAAEERTKMLIHDMDSILDRR